MPVNESVDQYLRIVRWAADRYTVRGFLPVSRGPRWSRYSRIEQAAWNRHCRNLETP